MLNLKVRQWENGGLEVSEDGFEMEVFAEVSKSDFEKSNPEISTYGFDFGDSVFLENGVILHEKDWNGEFYSGDYGTYRPVSQQVDDDFEVVGYAVEV